MSNVKAMLDESKKLKKSKIGFAAANASRKGVTVFTLRLHIPSRDGTHHDFHDTRVLTHDN